LSQLARSHGVVSLPTVKVYRHGKVVDTLYGAESENAAMLQLLEIARRDRGFRHDAGRVGLHAVFELLGDDDERVRRYRALLQAGMH
jgi:thioredoxin-like negative regulator of GroEL